MSPKAVFVHVGLPKTGTTYIQSSLWEARRRLASAGCLVPGEKRVSNWRAASDLLGRRPKGAEDPLVAGSWDAFVEAIRDWHGDRVVISEELLVTAGRGQVRRLVRSLSPAETHVVVTVRDLARVLPSVWQQEVKKGRTWTWNEFITAVREPDRGPATAAAAFWLRFDVPRILRLWEDVLPSTNIHVVILPPAGASANVLLERFAEAVGLDEQLLRAPSKGSQANAGLGLAEVEVLRRLNVGLGGQLNERQYVRAVVQAVIPVLQERAASRRVRLPVEYQGWATETSTDLVEFLKASSFHVVGQLDDLISPSGTQEASDPGDVDEAELVEPMTEALARVCTVYGRYWWQMRRPHSAVAGDSNVRLASRARAMRYQVKARFLERADSSKMLGRLARAYLRRTSSRS